MAVSGSNDDPQLVRRRAVYRDHLTKALGIPVKLVLQWGIPAIAILLLLAFKYGKPRGYLGDWWIYQTRPHVYCGLERDSQVNVPYLIDWE